VLVVLLGLAHSHENYVGCNFASLKPGSSKDLKTATQIMGQNVGSTTISTGGVNTYRASDSITVTLSSSQPKRVFEASAGAISGSNLGTKKSCSGTIQHYELIGTTFTWTGTFFLFF
jgi:hypothetical protein